MRSAVYYGKRDVRFMDRPEPAISEMNNVKIKVRCCGICGSDLEEYYYGPVVAPVEEHPLTHQKIPFTLGHELSGQVVEVGPNARNIHVGDWVVCHPVISCGQCYWCKKGVMCLCEQMACLGLQRDGGFADYVVVPETNCFPIPRDTDMRVITLIEPCATAVRNVRRGQVRFGDNVLILGGGTVGLLTIQTARLAGAKKIVVIEINEYRSQVALELGADAVFDPRTPDLRKKLLEVTGGEGVQVAIECVGKSESVVLATELIEKGGNVVLVGICPEPAPILTRNIARSEINIYGIHGFDYDDLRTSIDFIQSGRINAARLVTKVIPLEQMVEEGLEKLGPNGDRDIKIVVDMALEGGSHVPV